MDLGINQKVAFVSGGGNGMGRAIAEQFAREGCRVIVAALERDRDSIDDTVDTIRTSGGEAIGFAGDLTVKSDVDAAVEAARRTFGMPDIAIANVGGPPPGYFDEVSDQAFLTALEHMTMSMVYLARAVIPHMRTQRWGRIVTINSVGAKEPTPELAHVLVNPSRAAVVALNKSLSNEFAVDGITINTIGTGFIGTERMYNYMKAEAARRDLTVEEVLADLTVGVPAKRVGTPEEMAAIVVFLCSQGAGYINGELIAVDGGFHRAAF